MGGREGSLRKAEVMVKRSRGGREGGQPQES